MKKKPFNHVCRISVSGGTLIISPRGVKLEKLGYKLGDLIQVNAEPLTNNE